jgi:branched-chain amino acid aminotransferase
MLVRRGEIFRWDEHIERLQRGVDFLRLTIPYSTEELFRFSMQLIKRNRMPECLLRLNISRGITARGYSPKNAVHPAIVLSLHPVPVADGHGPARWRVITSSFCLPGSDPLTSFKTANKLPQVMARAEADAAGAHDALLLNPRGRIAEGTSCNVFWVQEGVVCSTPLRSGALAGVTRAALFELCGKMEIPAREIDATPTDLVRAQGVFLTNTSMGVVEVESLDGRKLPSSPLTKKLWAAYRALL